MLGHLAEAALTALLEQQGQEVDLEQHIAKLVEQLGVIAPLSGIGQLVGLLDRVGDDRALVLLTVPRAFAPQAAGDRVQALHRGGGVLAAVGHYGAAVDVLALVFGAL